MIELAYECKLPGHENHTYTLMQYGETEPFAFMIDGVVIGKLDMIDGNWEQTEGKDTPKEVIADIGYFLDHREG